MKTNDDSTSILTVFGAVFALILFLAMMGGLLLYGCWATAVVLTYLWGWFVVPVFGLAALTLPQAYGLALMVNFMTWQHDSHYDKDERELKERLIELGGILIRPWLILLIGWACHAFFM